jgi:hypothetical protein
MLYDLWERRGETMNWAGEALSFPAAPVDGPLWLGELGQKVAALGGYLEVRAVLSDQTVTLSREPGP